ncbi:hypothetical protein RvY_17466 [Ramazzottius varieornatus]|uniref:Rap-GAP domain-containing protein n=1 Tax=Ramazzottius varieornatus TaxID=947166 RepID=A0A1D1W2L6_RAMVA|nr:hypothetical protein RvY_17466 [Ramazzottius varieornatus]
MPKPVLRSRKPSAHHDLHFVYILVWMDTFRDAFVFPAQEVLSKLDLLNLLSTQDGDSELALTDNIDYNLIYIFPAAHGMYEVRLRSMQNNPILAAVPLVNGIVVSHNILGALICDCAINSFTRKRLNLESYVPGHVQRRTIVQDITQRFAVKTISDSSWGF